MKSVIKIQGKNMDDHSFNKILEVCSWEEGLDDKYLAVLPINHVSTAYDDIKNILLDKDFLNDVKNNKCKIIIFLTDQGDPRYDTKIGDSFNSLLSEYDLSNTSISFFTCESGDNPMSNISILEYNFPLTEFYTSNLDTLDLTESIFKYVIRKRHKRPHYFCCFNGTFKNHRTILFYNLLKNNLLENNLCSYTSYNKFEDDGGIGTDELLEVLEIEDETDTKKGKTQMYYVNKMLSMLPYCTDSILEDANSGVHTYDINIMAHFSSYFNVCTSSGYNGFPYLDDKTYKPILTFQPFIIVGEYRSLEALRKCGFKTFDGFIDESYDKEKDYRKRLDLIVNEIKRLCSMSITEIDEWYKSMNDILIHNFERMKIIFDSDIQGERINNFVDNLFINDKSSYVKIHEGYDNLRNQILFKKRTEKIKDFKNYLQSLSREQTRYKAGATYSDIVIDGKSLCDARRGHKNQHLRVDKIVNSIGDIKDETFIDFGTNTGYMIFRLKEFGAGKCVGVDGSPDLISISNRINEIEGYDDVHFRSIDFLEKGAIVPFFYDPSDINAFETFDYGICFSSVNAVCSKDEPFYEVSEWLKTTVSKVVPVLFIEFSEYITNTPWEDEFNIKFYDMDKEDRINELQKQWPNASQNTVMKQIENTEKDIFFKTKTEEMFNSLDFIKSWELLGITDYNRNLYRLDFE